MTWKAVGVVRLGRAENSDQLGQRRVGAGLRIQRLDGHPHGVDADHRSGSQVQAARFAAALVGQAIVIVNALSQSSTSMRSSALWF